MYSVDVTGRLLLVPVVGTREYELDGAFICELGEIPAGFRTDGASLPRLLWPLLGSPFSPEIITAAVIHDYAYRFGAWPRHLADGVLFTRLVQDGVARGRARLFWYGVTLFGWFYWRRCRYGRGING